MPQFHWQREELKIAIRVDTSSQIGTGHFMRCLTLADALGQRGAQVRFISCHLPTHFEEMLAARGHQFMPLDNGPVEVNAGDLAHAHRLRTSQYADAQMSIQALSNQVWDWLIVDHYALDVHWEAALRQTAKNILVIDDLADRQHDCDVLLDQNFYADMDSRYTDKVPAHCRVLRGPRYALLRDEFRQLRKQVKPRTGTVKRVLVFFGGVDTDDYTSRIVNALVNLGIEDLHVDVVIGAQHPHREPIELACAQHRFGCHVQTSRIAELMAAADLAIGAGGSATWERCCMGLPTFVICTAENQVKQINDAALECLLYAPELSGELVHAVERHLCALMENNHLRQAISRNAIQAVDGRGVLRVIGHIWPSGIDIRVASQEDSEQLYRWRNHPTIRAVSRNPEVIEWKDHQEWLARVLSSPSRLLLIGQREGIPVGVVRFDIQNDEAEVSIYVVPGINDAGLGRELLLTAERWIATNRPNLNRVRANVVWNNEQSRNLFLGAGYQPEFIHYSRRLRQNDK